MASASVRRGEICWLLRVRAALVALALVSVTSCGDDALTVLAPATKGVPSTGGDGFVEGSGAQSVTVATGGVYGSGGMLSPGGGGAGSGDYQDFGGSGATGDWVNRQNEDECPGAMPDEGGLCNVRPGVPCRFYPLEYFCSNHRWFCYFAGTVCPCQFPQGLRCLPFAECYYPGSVCGCPDEEEPTWDCTWLDGYDPVADWCPGLQPAEGSRCGVPDYAADLTCDYASATCRCEPDETMVDLGVWSCADWSGDAGTDSGLGASPPIAEDAGTGTAGAGAATETTADAGVDASIAADASLGGALSGSE